MRQARRTCFSITVFTLELQGLEKLSNFMRIKSHANKELLDQIPTETSCCYSYFLSEFIFPFHHLLLISCVLIFSQSQ